MPFFVVLRDVFKQHFLQTAVRYVDIGHLACCVFCFGVLCFFFFLCGVLLVVFVVVFCLGFILVCISFVWFWVFLFVCLVWGGLLLFGLVWFFLFLLAFPGSVD